MDRQIVDPGLNIKEIQYNYSKDINDVTYCY